MIVPGPSASHRRLVYTTIACVAAMPRPAASDPCHVLVQCKTERTDGRVEAVENLKCRGQRGTAGFSDRFVSESKCKGCSAHCKRRQNP